MSLEASAAFEARRSRAPQAEGRYAKGQNPLPLVLEVDYEGLITNRITLTPSFEIDLPLVDDHAVGVGAFGPKVEIGLRLSHDLVDRLISPYIGIHYERNFGESANLARQDGENAGVLFAVVGARILF